MVSVPLFATQARIPRPYQIEAHDNTLKLWDSGVTGVLIRLFTGGGKSFCAGMLIESWLNRSPQHRALVLSYEKQLVWQFAEELEGQLGFAPGIEMQQEHVSARDMPLVTVACRQSLLVSKPATAEQMERLNDIGFCVPSALPERYAAKLLAKYQEGMDLGGLQEAIDRFLSRPEVTDDGSYGRLHKFDPLSYNWMVVMDEAHKWTVQLSSVRPLVEWFERNPENRRCGLTGTPRRSDGVSIGDKMFPGIAIDYPLFRLDGPCAVADGYAVKYQQLFIPVEGVVFTKIGKLLSELKSQAAIDTQVGRLICEEGILAKLVSPALDVLEEKTAIIYSPTVDMARDVAAFINARRRCLCAQCDRAAWYELPLIGDGAECRECHTLIGLDAIVERTNKEQCVAVWGEMPAQQRKHIYAAHKRGEFQYLSVCSLCIAKGSLILTDRGEVPIEDVTTDMKLWDGVEFVSHDGVICNGFRPVIEYAGLTATEDHNVWTADGWKTLAECKQTRLAIALASIDGFRVWEIDHCYRCDGIDEHYEGQQSPSTPQEVYDILNTGPRHRFTANGLIVSNCKEGYDTPTTMAIVNFRQISRKAVSLAEQIKARAGRVWPGIIDGLETAEERLTAIAASPKPFATVVDLTGISSLSEAASTADIYLEGLDDEVRERALDLVDKAAKNGEAVDVAAQVQQARDEIDAEHARQQREKEEAARRRQAEKEVAERRKQARREEEDAERQRHAELRARAGAEVKYRVEEVGHNGERVSSFASPKQIKFLSFCGLAPQKPITKKQSGRMIDILLSGKKPVDAAFLTGLRDNDWMPTEPSEKQKKFLRWKRVVVAEGMTPRQASILISVVKDRKMWQYEWLRRLQTTSTHDKCQHLAVELGVVKQVLPQQTFAELVAAGKRQRQQVGVERCDAMYS